jgi:cobaltochelatase CobT
MPAGTGTAHPQAAAARALSRVAGFDPGAPEGRADADAAALWARFHDPALAGPRDPPALRVLERARVAALGARAYAGVADNLTGALPGADPLYAAAFRVLAGDGRPAGGLTGAVARHLGPMDLADQRAYAAAARALLAELGLLEPAPEGQEEQEPEPDEGPQDDAAPPDAQEAGQAGQTQDTAQAAPAGPGAVGAGAALHAPGYRVYTRAYDRVVRPGDLAGHAELTTLRARLDEAVAPHRAAIARLAARLARALTARPRTHWHFDQAEGDLDASRLARLVARPTSEPMVFKREAPAPARDAAVTLLLDNSGSMRGRPIALAAVTAELMARALERAGVAVEVLGFTTAAWKGGRARADWLAAGAPGGPGRLGELLHIVYKAAGQPWRRARAGMGLMLREGLLKENIDGEALAWAHGRLVARPETRRVLIVISDGAPVDDATMAANGAGYLSADLTAVVGAIGRRGAVELAAIGIGHDVGRHYPRAVTIRDADALAPALADALEGLLKG